MSKVRKIQSKNKRADILLISLLCVVAAAVVLVAVIIAVNIFALNENSQSAEFVPPEFDSEAAEGVPSVPDGMGYLEVYKEGMSFNAFVCGEVNVVNGKADVYFTNPEKNTIWMKLRVFDENGTVIAETGLIKPNEYLKTISFEKIPANNSKIKMKIMTYEPTTYYSGGAVSLNTVAKVK